MPIDYSKWDHMEDSSSSSCDNGDDDDFASNEVVMPRVTRLDVPSQVTFGGVHNKETVNVGASPDNGVVARSSTTTDPPSSIATSNASSTRNDVPLLALEAISKSTTTTATSTTSSHDQQWIQRGGIVTTDDGRKLYWCQDRYSVTIRLELMPTEKVYSVNIDGVLTYADRHSATGTTTATAHPHLTCYRATQKQGRQQQEDADVLFEGDLTHPIHYADDDDDDIDWSIVRVEDSSNNNNNFPTRYLQITLYKAVPMPGMFVWWKRPLMQFPEMELMGEDIGSRTTASKDFLNAWEEAHKIFQQNRRQNQERG
jgi:hypothetical protein